MLARYDALVASGGDVSVLRQEIDRVAGQRDAHASRLFWYTDLEQAKAEAKSTGSKGGEDLYEVCLRRCTELMLLRSRSASA